MDVKSAIFVLLFVQNCLSYPIDGHDTTNDAELPQQFSNGFSSDSTNAQIENFTSESEPINSHHETRQYVPEMEPNAMQFASDYINNGVSNMHTHLGGHKPIHKPPRPEPPIQIPDDVEVFSPPGPPWRPFPPPRPIPNGPLPHSVIETFWPINENPVKFPNGEVFNSDGSLGMLSNHPIVFERERVPMIHEHIGGDIRMVPEPMKNERPVVMEMGDVHMLPEPMRNERPVMMENDEVHMAPEPMRNERPVIMEKDDVHMIPQAVRNERPMMMERDDVPMMPEILHQEQLTQMMPIHLESGPVHMAPNIMEKMDRSMIIEEQPKMIPHFMHNEQGMPFMSPEGQSEMKLRNPVDFVQIPQVLPERLKRDNQNFDHNSKTTNIPQKKESDRVKGKSVMDNEISNDDSMQNNFIFTENKYAEDSSTEKLSISNQSDMTSAITKQDETSPTTDNISPTITSTVIDTSRPDSDFKILIDNEKPITVENNPIYQSVSNEPIEEIFQDFQKILNEGDPYSISKILIDEDLDVSTITQPSNNKVDEKVPIMITRLDSKNISNHDDLSPIGKPLVDNDSKYEQQSIEDISTIDEKIVISTSTSPSNTKIEDMMNTNPATGETSYSDISTTDQLPTKNDEKMTTSTSVSTLNAVIEDLNRNLVTDQSLNSDITLTTQPPNYGNSEKMELTSTNTLGEEIKEMNRNLPHGESSNLEIPVTEQPSNKNKKIDEETLASSSMTAASIANGKIDTVNVNTNLTPSEGIQSNKPTEISTSHSITSTEEIQDKLLEELETEMKILLQDMKNNTKWQNITLNQLPIDSPNINHPSVLFDPNIKSSPILYAPSDEFPNAFYIHNGNVRDPIVFSHPSPFEDGVHDLQYHLNNELGQLLGDIFDMQHELQSFSASHGPPSLRPMVYTLYKNLHYPIPPFAPLPISLRAS